MSIVGKIGPVECQIFPGMEIDVLLGHDALHGCGVVIDYKNRKVSSDGHTVKFGTRIHVLKALLAVHEQHELALQKDE